MMSSGSTDGMRALRVFQKLIVERNAITNAFGRNHRRLTRPRVPNISSTISATAAIATSR